GRAAAQRRPGTAPAGGFEALPEHAIQPSLEQSHGCAEIPCHPVPPWPAPFARRADRQAAVDRPDHRRDPPAPPRDRRRLLPRQEGHRHQDLGGRGRLRTRSGRAPRARPACGQSPAPAGAFPAGVRMSERIYSRIAGTGSYLPEKVVTNDDLAKVVDTSDEWIRTRTGIRERRVAAEGQAT